MKNECATSVGVRRTTRAAAIAFVLCSPLYAGAQESSDDKRPAVDGQKQSDVASSATKPADNTAHNADDRAGNDLTPLDQSGAETDIEITRSIRRSLIDDDTLGTNAKNVKVITVDGKVTLRGAVANAADQTRIVAIAKGAAGPNSVADELQVIKD